MDANHQACSYCGEIYELKDMAQKDNTEYELIMDQIQQNLTKIAYELHTANHKLTTLNKIIGRIEEKDQK